MKPKSKSLKKKGSQTGNRKEWIYIGLVILATFILFSPAVKNDFTNWDDDLYVTKNQSITSLSFDNLEKFSENFVGNFHPLTMISLALDYHFFGLDPFYYHLKNIIFHLLNTLLVFVLIKKISGNNLFISLFTALLFGIHPMHVESVAWIAERKDVLYTFYFLAGLLFYYEYLKKRKLIYIAATALMFVLSTLAKSAAVVFPVVLILLDYYEGRKITLLTFSEKIPFFILSLIIGLTALRTQTESNAMGDFEYFSFFEKIRYASYGLFTYLFNFLFPHKLSSFHPYPDRNNIPEIYNLALIAILAIVIYLVFWGRKKKWLIFGSLFYVITVALVLQFITVGNAVTAERYTYVPYIGIGFIYAWLFNKVFFELKNQGLKYILGILLAIQLVYFTTTTYNRTKVWKDSATLWADVIEKYPNESGAYSNRGHFFRTQNKYDLALNDYNKAIQLDNKNSRAYSNRGKVWFDTGQIDKALEDYTKSIEINSTVAETYSNRGAAYGLKKDYDNALKDLNKALQIESDNKEALSNRGFVYFQLQQYQKTVDDYNLFLKISPNDPDIINTLGLCYRALNDNTKALDEFNKAIKIDPSKGAFFLNRSYALYSLGDKTNALNDALKAQQLGSNVNQNYLALLKQ